MVSSMWSQQRAIRCMPSFFADSIGHSRLVDVPAAVMCSFPSASDGSCTISGWREGNVDENLGGFEGSMGSEVRRSYGGDGAGGSVYVFGSPGAGESACSECGCAGPTAGGSE